MNDNWFEIVAAFVVGGALCVYIDIYGQYPSNKQIFQFSDEIQINLND